MNPYPSENTCLILPNFSKCNLRLKILLWPGPQARPSQVDTWTEVSHLNILIRIGVLNA